MKYQALKKVFHRYDDKQWENTYQERLKHHTTFLLEHTISPIRDQKQLQEIQYPLFVSMAMTLTMHIEQVYRNTLHIHHLTRQLPMIALNAYTRKLLINELQATNEKENVQSSKEILAEVLNNDLDNMENKRFKGLVKQYALLGEGENNIIQPSDYRVLYDKLLENDVEASEAPDGKYFRKKSVGVYDNSKGEWMHRSEYTEAEIISRLNEIISFKQKEDIPWLIKVMAAHYMFEYLHPFYDGNGRLGRYLIAKSLHDELDVVSALTFSYTVNRNRNKYDKAFESASEYLNKGELTFFVDTMLELLIEGQLSAIEDLESNIHLLKRLENGLKQQDCTNEDMEIFFILIQDKVFGSRHTRITLKDLSQVLNMSRPTLNKWIKNHEDELTQLKKKPSIYELTDDFIMKLLAVES